MAAPVTDDKTTISPGIRFLFKERAHELCELAEVDYADQPRKSTEWVCRMEERWRRHMAGPFIDDDKAASRALAEFGSAKDAARAFRRGWHGFFHRLL